MMTKRVAASLLVLLAATVGMQAGTISVVDLPAVGTDAASDISTAKTYTHALDFVGSQAAATINGVAFTQATAFTGTDYAYSSPSTTNHLDVELRPGQADGGMHTLLVGFFFADCGTTPTPAYLTLSGLTAGTQYSTRVYYQNFADDARTNDVTFNGDGTPVTLEVNQSISGAHYLEYNFTASGDSVTITTQNKPEHFSFLMYGVTNEVVPEPTTMGLLALGGGLSLLRRKRG